MFLHSVALAQDERFFRDFLSKDLQIKRELKKEKVHFRSISEFYDFDLNGDYRNESFIFEKKDGQGILYIYSYDRKKIFGYEFETLGKNARPYRISVKNLSSKTKVFIVYYYEGNANYLKFKGSSRLYFLTIDNNDLNTLSMYKGPPVFEEFENFKKGHYHQRIYNVRAEDFNTDGTKELSVEYGLTSRVYFYKSNGKWITF